MNTTYLPGIDMSLEAYERDAIELLRMFEPKEGSYYGCFSGGKDSCVIKELARMAGVKVEWNYNVTTIDPPELVRFIRNEHTDVHFNRPEKNFFTVMVDRGFPTRRGRWCCEEFKERKSPEGSVNIIGVRAAESRRRRSWQQVSMHIRTRQVCVAPILHWSDEMVWKFILNRKLAYCGLYDEGFQRLGCIGCPIANTKNRQAEFARWPGFERKWKETFKKIWERRAGTQQRDGREWFGSEKFDSWEAMWEWWLHDTPLPNEKEECQGLIELFS